ncbi:TetR/AcrR family transcriptional regulator [Catenuloplanes atrovinosus]|uniref:AcrR family transcriptional regulator n=1 Tax=Catenuloplanes atrovinosus TaxID=137266 RepID=A0AAE3YM89_9ACTN|nr:helix-turn-helix domain-containing protein [Catenuloplanes atrovinosus]MDR7276379.1 AcrR family transcriptional regulator [Catenuloplanes atrovinosus]
MSTTQAGPARRSRRAGYTAATHRSILEAARRLFRERGYFAVKVEEVARAARVSPATVYAVAGGKAGLLRSLMRLCAAAPAVTANLELIDRAGDPGRVLDLVAATTLDMRREWGDVLRVIMATAPHEPDAAASLAEATERYRSGLRLAAQRLARIGALRSGVDVAHADALLWFYFGYSSLFTLVDDLHWSDGEAVAWLRTAAADALLAPAAGA